MREQNLRSSVRWADGTYDSKRACDECGSTTCVYPVHNDCYGEVVTKKSYRNFVEALAEDNYESANANPDILKGQDYDEESN